MIEERLEDTGRQIAMGVGRAGGGLALRVGEKTAGWFLRLGGRGLSAMRGVIRRGRDTGRMSEKRLQRLAGGDIHAIELERHQVRAVVRSLRRAGVRYSVERDSQSTWIHFEGRDLDHVTHAVRRALQDVGYELRIDGRRPVEQLGSKDTQVQPAADPGRDEPREPAPVNPEQSSPTLSDAAQSGSRVPTATAERCDEASPAVVAEQSARPISDDEQPPQSPVVSSPAARGETATTADEANRQTVPEPAPSGPRAPVSPKPAVRCGERKVSRRDTLAELRARIERKLTGKPVRPVATRKPNRSQSR
ncbi:MULTISPECIES: DUF3801 domain-containing protein [unclassified Bifidobacterium]|uniref:DUF3801 domain-containing protein n=1 Tax=unclassified Bifidobacterium TaxID=2608897 RepID=UPI001126299E|nr:MULTISPECIES: DUF3801 domain-containing protein [unclassified Bifidobacterium]TPF78264.1 hypothetical protein BW09_05435 [Bifidobacterium sp. UTCIF-1]TPF79718.1 hypothetical protein BW08_08615 [Bifidobacterium sp. UTCIF-24]TPF82500.1 hypothetical protein BW12_04480 [Bifidobacterium sp. UTCIF-3]TPF84130.1 hypothetical protein BW07_06385 [Bifidobacterium sp. UTCIF-36]TPF89374.1 hypothetical protein BW10_06650 [Bifidobacterium sp. UTBIF-56]